MPYPTELIDAIKIELGLNDAEYAELSILLQEPSVQSLIETNTLSIANIVYTQTKPTTSKKFMMSKSDLARLVANQEKIKALRNPSRPTNLSDLYFWLAPEGSDPFCYVIHTSLVEKFTTPMYFSTIPFLPATLLNLHKNCPSFKKFEEAMDHLMAIHNIPLRRTATLDFIKHHVVEDLEYFLNEFSPKGSLEILHTPGQEILKKYLKQTGSALRKTAKEFYIEKFRNSGEAIGEITFSIKKSGSQFGTEMQVAREGKGSITYFIKSQQNGPQFSSDRRAAEKSTEPLELKEVFIYHALAALKRGPKADIFFVRDESIGGVYISTQDLSCSKKHPPHTKLFHPYDRIKAEQQQINNERSIEEITLLDILARLFRLSDMNQGNFGRVTVMQEGSVKKEQWRFVDFRTPLHETYTYDNIIGGFLEGNGSQSYERTFQQLLLNGSELERLQRAIKALSAYKDNFAQHIEMAYTKTLNFLDRHRAEIALPNEEGAREDLEKYAKSVSKNFHQFLEEASQKIERLQKKRTFQAI